MSMLSKALGKIGINTKHFTEQTFDKWIAPEHKDLVEQYAPMLASLVGVPIPFVTEFMAANPVLGQALWNFGTGMDAKDVAINAAMQYAANGNNEMGNGARNRALAGGAIQAIGASQGAREDAQTANEIAAILAPQSTTTSTTPSAANTSTLQDLLAMSDAAGADIQKNSYNNVMAGFEPRRYADLPLQNATESDFIRKFRAATNAGRQGNALNEYGAGQFKLSVDRQKEIDEMRDQEERVRAANLLAAERRRSKDGMFSSFGAMLPALIGAYMGRGKGK